MSKEADIRSFFNKRKREKDENSSAILNSAIYEMQPVTAGLEISSSEESSPQKKKIKAEYKPKPKRFSEPQSPKKSDVSSDSEITFKSDQWKWTLDDGQIGHDEFSNQPKPDEVVKSPQKSDKVDEGSSSKSDEEAEEEEEYEVEEILDYKWCMATVSGIYELSTKES